MIFQTQGEDARLWQKELGQETFTETDFKRLEKYHAVAQVATDRGVSAPVTIRALPPKPPTGVARLAEDYSAQTYGRPLDEVRAELEKRYDAPETPRSKRPPISGW